MPLFRRRRRQRVLRLNLNNTYEELKIPVDRNKLIEGNIRTLFEPASVFHEKKPFLSLKRPKNMVLVVEGAYKALSFRRGDTTLQPYWTNVEADKFADRTIAHKLAEMRPVTWGQIIALVIGIGIVGVLVLKAIMNTGGF